ncbi:MAG: VanW family protein, partial [Candidatus Magasanikbacteria bacterium]|nr:VanW family protein [Candidatus Magasanikbacteria bacterium]
MNPTENKQINQKASLRWSLLAVTAFLIILVMLADVFFSYEEAFRGRFYRGVHIGLTDVSGLSPTQAALYLNGQTTSFYSEGLPYYYRDHQVSVRPIVGGTLDTDLAFDVFSFDIDSSISLAYKYGRTEPWPVRFRNQLAAFFFSKTIPVSYELDENKLKDILTDNFKDYEVPPQNAQLLLAEKKLPNGSVDLSVKIKPHKSGEVFDYNGAINETKLALEGMNYAAIKLNQSPSAADIDYDLASSLAYSTNVSRYIDLAPITLTYANQSWTISRNQLLAWLDFGRIDGNVALVLKANNYDKFLDKLAKEISHPAVEPRFQIKDGVVSELKIGQDGVNVLLDETRDHINEALNNFKNHVAIPVEKVRAQATAQNINELGVKEIIGIGKSNFAGSPANRRSNIAVGAAQLHGVLIRPGEEFSLITTLGKIDDTNGYKQELVIKGNKTTPEFGGGLCQIGTTTFRSVLASGLPVLERQNHSYRVAYYEPAGTDATIYSPKPDFRFLNDTGKYILIQTKIKGNDLTFEFWGTKDGRAVEQTKPVVYNIKPPPPKELIETENLKPG